MLAFRLDGAAVLRSPPELLPSGAGPGPAESSARTVVPGGLRRPQRPPTRPGHASVLPLTDREVLALRGSALAAEDREILSAFAAQLATALEATVSTPRRPRPRSLARANQLRSALLAR